MTRLHELMNRLTQSISGDSLELSETLEGNALGSAMENLNKYTDFVLRDPKVKWAVLDIELVVTGNILLLNLFQVTISLSVKVGETEGLIAKLLVTDANTGQVQRLQGVPWLACKNAVLSFDFVERLSPQLTGTFGVSVLAGSKWVPFQVLLTESEQPTTFQSTLDANPPLIHDMMPFLGGLKLPGIQSQASHLDPASSFKCLAASFDYDVISKDLESIEVKLEIHTLNIGYFVPVTAGTLVILAKPNGDRIDYTVKYEGEIELQSGALVVDGELGDKQWTFKIRVQAESAVGGVNLTDLLGPLSAESAPGWTNGVKISELACTVISSDNQFKYEGNATFKSGTEVSGLQLQLDNLFISGGENSLSFQLTAAVKIDALEISVSSVYAHNQWTSLCGEINESQLATISGQHVPSVTQAKLCLSGENVWTLSAITELKFEMLRNLSVRSKLNLTYTDSTWNGSICGDLDFHGIELEACYEPDQDSKLSLSWHGIKLSHSHERDEWTALLDKSEYNLGWLVSEAVSWVEGIRYGLPSPWDELHGISLPNCQIKFNFNSPRVDVVFDFDWSLPFAQITGFELTYDPGASTSKNLSFGLKGDFSILGIEVPHWNPADSSAAPSLPGVGTGMFDLNFLALGQHVSINSTSVFDNVDHALATLQSATKNPLENDRIIYDSSAGWIFAADMKFLRDIKLSLIFNDPKLYALKLSTKESENPLFANLVFEIMYQRVTDKIGLYQADITLPDAMRYLEFGAYSITLPSFAIGVYTNGDFKLDIGFPHHYDFSRSFTIQTIVPPGIPVIGSAGFYINKLSENTATRVPVTSRGKFSPVLEFGFGMRLGLGKEVHKGPLNAGFSFTVIGMLEGVLASWQPYGQKDESDSEGDNQLAKQFYYYLSGTAGIQGRLYGHVDLSIIKASVDVTITIASQMAYEAYRDLEIAVIAEVEIHIKLKIGRKPFQIKINIDYSARIREAFVIEANGKAPWDERPSEVRTLHASNEHTLNPCSRHVHQIEHMNWSNLISVERQPLLIYAVPTPTGAQADDKMKPVYAMIFAIGTMKEEQGDDSPLSDFEKLCEKLLQWLLAAADNGPVNDKEQLTSYVTLERIYEIQKYLCGTGSTGFSIPLQAVEQFLENHCMLQIKAIPKATAQSGDGQPPAEIELDSTFFPAIPGLTLKMTLPNDENAILDRQFDAVSSASRSYLVKLAEYFRTLAVEVEREQKAARPLAAEAMNASTSIADFVLNDYFVTKARHLSQAAADVMNDFETVPQGLEIKVFQMCLDMFLYKYGESGDAVIDGGRDEINDKNQFAIKRCAPELFELNSELPLAPGVLFITGARHRIVPSEDKFETIASNDLYRGGKPENPSTFTAVDMLKLPNNAASQQLITPGTYSYKVAEELDKTLVIGDKVSLLSLTAYRDTQGQLNASQLLEDYPTLKPLASSEIEIPRFAYNTSEQETLAQVAAKFGVTVRSLAEDQDNLNRQGLFNGSSVRYGRLKQLDMGTLLKETRRTGGFRSLSGMVSRFFLHGLRLRADSGLTVNDSMLSNRDDYSLFELTGQQFIIPDSEQPFDLTLDAEHVPWVEFINETEE